MPRDRTDAARWALAAAVALAAVLFALRGPVRAVQGAPYDWSLIYSASRAWLTGASPYDGAAVAAVFIDAGGPAQAVAARGNSHLLLYPPPSFVPLTPVAAMPWTASKWVWAAVNVACYAGAIWAVLGIAGLRWSSRAGLALIAVAAGFGAAHTALALGQTSLLTLGCIAVGAWLLHRGGLATAGAALALATAIKPQLGLPFLIYALAVGRWRALWPAALTLGTISALGVGRLWLADVAWLDALRGNVEAFSRHGAGNPTGRFSYQLINLQMLLHRLVDGRAIVTALTWAITAALAVGYGWKGRGARGEQRRAKSEDASTGSLGPSAPWPLLCDFSMVGVLALLPLYHRYYDAVVLLFAIAWTVTVVRDGRWRVGTAAVIALAPLLVPWPAMMVVLAGRGMVPPAVTETWAWQTLVLPLHVWALVALAGIGVAASRGGRAG